MPRFPGIWGRQARHQPVSAPPGVQVEREVQVEQQEQPEAEAAAVLQRQH